MLLEQQVGALLQGRERMSVRIMKLREFIAALAHNSDDELTCTAWKFFAKDAKS
jgi:hypothetical protein